MPRIPFGNFEPDKSPFNPGASPNVINALPVADGWGPMPSFTEVSVALESECLGAAIVKDTSGNVEVFAGTADSLFKLDTSSQPYAWSEVSKSVNAYTASSDSRWQFATFGDYLVAVNGTDTPQYWLSGTSTNFADLTGAPVGKYVWAAGDFIVIGNLSGGPNEIQWCGLNDITFWTVGERGADKQVIPDKGAIQGGIGDQRGMVVLCEDGMDMYRQDFSSGYTFVRATGNPKRGVFSPYSVARIGTNDFVYLSEDGFFRGLNGIPIGGERVDSFFKAVSDPATKDRVQGFPDPFRKIVWFRYQTVSGNYEMLGWDWQLDRWCYTNEEITEAARIIPAGTTWDGLANFYSTIDDASDVTFDSEIWKGGDPIFAGFTTDNKLAFFAGPAKMATFETNELTFGENRVWVNGARLIGDATSHTGYVGHADYHGETILYNSGVSPSSRSNHLPFRSDGRLHQFKITVPTGETWSHVTGLDVQLKQGGKI